MRPYSLNTTPTADSLTVHDENIKRLDVQPHALFFILVTSLSVAGHDHESSFRNA